MSLKLLSQATPCLHYYTVLLGLLAQHGNCEVCFNEKMENMRLECFLTTAPSVLTLSAFPVLLNLY